MGRQKVLIFIVSYHAEDFIVKVLQRIPSEIWNQRQYETEILIIDDASKDRTFQKAEEYARSQGCSNLTVLYNPKNLGYGGNQKIGFHYAIQNNFDAVVLLHGDGQYAPELLQEMIDPITNDGADVVFGSRMLRKQDALKGGMPLYKWVGNQILTFIENRILGSHLSEFHTGYRAYRVAALRSIPFNCNSDYFDFDTDIIIQMVETGKKIVEIPIPTHYGEEECRVDGMKYARLILMSCLQARISKFGVWYSAKFDYELTNTHYTAKFGFPSSHQFALDHVAAGSTVLDLGCGPGFMAKEIRTSKTGTRTISVDQYIQPDVRAASTVAIETDLDSYDFDLKQASGSKVDTILALDIIEHLRKPEKFLTDLRNKLSRHEPRLVLTTGNIGFFLIRLSLLFGRFSYGKKGILDLDHTRLFTFKSLRRSLEMTGYEILEEKGIPAPFPLAFGNNAFSRLLLAINQLLIKVSRGAYSYQMAFVARPKATLDHLLEDAKQGRKDMLQAYFPAPQPDLNG